MAGLQSMGIGSGLDIKSLISQLMTAEKQPLTALDKKEANYQAKLTAYGTLKSAVASFQTAAKALAVPSKINTMKATVGDAAVATATPSSIAKSASYSLEVSQLAQSQKLYSTPYAEATATVGTGSISFQFGSYDGGTPPTGFTPNPDKTATTVTIDSDHQSLTGVRDAINAANAGVTASIVNDGSGYRLSIKSNDSGAANAMKITVSGDSSGSNTDATGLSALAYDPESAVYNLVQDADNKAQDAIFKLDGITISKKSNTVGDAISGVTLTLLKKNVGSPTTLTVAPDSASLKSSLDAFVKAYNDLDSTFDTLGSYNFKTGEAGQLLGDASMRSIQSQVRKLLTSSLDTAGGGLTALSDIGISLQRDGTLTLNSSKLESVLADPTKNVASLFAPMGVSIDSLVTYAGHGPFTKAGLYGVDLTQVATRGDAKGQSVAGTTINSGNNSLNLKVDGLTTSVTLTNGSYTATTLAAELQLQINTALSNSGHGVAVSVNSGKLTITSNSWGSSSSVLVTGGSGASNLFGSTLSTTGQDVAGTIGGTTATGQGQLLTGSSDASGLKLLVEGGSAGSRGTVGFSYGIASQLDSLLTNILDEDSGSLSSATASVDLSIKAIGNQRTALNRRLEQIQARYTAQFTALDSLIASMQQTSSYLSQQLANLPNTSSSSK